MSVKLYVCAFRAVRTATTLWIYLTRRTVTSWPQPRPESWTTCCCTETQCACWARLLQKGEHQPLCLCELLEDHFSAFVTCFCVFVCNSSEDSPSASEKIPDCDVLLEPTLLGPLRGDGSAVSLHSLFICYECVSLHVSFLWFWV